MVDHSILKYLSFMAFCHSNAKGGDYFPANNYSLYLWHKI